MMITRETNCCIDRLRTVLSMTNHAGAVFGKLLHRDLRKLVKESFCHIVEETRSNLTIFCCVGQVLGACIERETHVPCWSSSAEWSIELMENIKRSCQT